MCVHICVSERKRERRNKDMDEDHEDKEYGCSAAMQKKKPIPCRSCVWFRGSVTLIVPSPAMYSFLTLER